MYEQIFGWLSIVFCLVGFSMQIHKIIFKKNINSISLLTFCCTIIGSMFWSIHSLCVSAFHGGFENAIITSSSCVILFCSLRGKINLLRRQLLVAPIALVSFVFAIMLWINYLKPNTIVISKNVGIELATGCVAGVLMSISFLPQVFKVIKTRDVNDISVYMCLFYGLAQVVLIIYWSSRSQDELGKWLPGVIFCSCVLSLQCSLLTLKICIGKSKFLVKKTSN